MLLNTRIEDNSISLEMNFARVHHEKRKKTTAASKKKLALILAATLIILVGLLALVLVPPPTSPPVSTPTPSPTYTLTITNTTGGTTNPAPGNYTYPEGSLVTVAATAFTGYVFDHWKLDGVNVESNPINVTMDTNHTLHAVFKPLYTLTITATAGGTTDPEPGSYQFLEGDVIDVTAIPETDFILDHWELDEVNQGASNSIDVTMNANHTLHAVFTEITYTLTISVTTGGTTNPAPGAHGYGYGSMATVTAISDPDYYFDHWTLDGSPAGSINPINVLMNADHDLEAIFTQITYNITITTTTGGTTNPAPGDYVYPSGTNVSVTAIPQDSYDFDHWELDGFDVGSANPYTVTMDTDHNLHAVFKLVVPTYTLTITSTTGGTTNPSPGAHLYEEGTVVSVKANPSTDYVFDHWVLDSSNAGSHNPISVTMDKDHTLHAVFKEASPPPPPVGGHALPIDKTHFLTPKIDYSPGIGLAFVLLAAMAVTTILIRRRNRHSGGNLEGSVA